MKKINHTQLTEIVENVLEEERHEIAKNQGSEHDSHLAYNIMAVSSVVTMDILIRVLKHLDLYED